jgi:transposase-like protein
MEEFPMSYDYNLTEPANGVSENESGKVEVVAKARRRQFSASYKKRICSEADACTRPGELGALLRREGLHSSTVRRWRQQQETGALGGLNPKKRGPKPAADPALVRELAKKDKRIARLEKKLAQAELIIDIQKKVSLVLGIELRGESE